MSFYSCKTKKEELPNSSYVQSYSAQRISRCWWRASDVTEFGNGYGYPPDLHRKHYTRAGEFYQKSILFPLDSSLSLWYNFN